MVTSLRLVRVTGDLESAPVLRRVSSDGCVYELEWYTAAACVLSKTQGDDCRVEDAQAGAAPTLPFLLQLSRRFSPRCFISRFNPHFPSADLAFDLSPLSKPDGGAYKLTSGTYDYYVNVCGAVKAPGCPDTAGACQVEKK